MSIPKAQIYVIDGLRVAICCYSKELFHIILRSIRMQSDLWTKDLEVITHQTYNRSTCNCSDCIKEICHKISSKLKIFYKVILPIEIIELYESSSRLFILEVTKEKIGASNKLKVIEGGTRNGKVTSNCLHDDLKRPKNCLLKLFQFLDLNFLLNEIINNRNNSMCSKTEIVKDCIKEISREVALKGALPTDLTQKCLYSKDSNRCWFDYPRIMDICIHHKFNARQIADIIKHIVTVDPLQPDPVLCIKNKFLLLNNNKKKIREKRSSKPSKPCCSNHKISSSSSVSSATSAYSKSATTSTSSGSIIVCKSHSSKSQSKKCHGKKAIKSNQLTSKETQTESVAITKVNESTGTKFELPQNTVDPYESFYSNNAYQHSLPKEMNESLFYEEEPPCELNYDDEMYDPSIYDNFMRQSEMVENDDEIPLNYYEDLDENSSLYDMNDYENLSEFLPDNNLKEPVRNSKNYSIQNVHQRSCSQPSKPKRKTFRLVKNNCLNCSFNNSDNGYNSRRVTLEIEPQFKSKKESQNSQRKSNLKKYASDTNLLKWNKKIVSNGSISQNKINENNFIINQSQAQSNGKLFKTGSVQTDSNSFLLQSESACQTMPSYYFQPVNSVSSIPRYNGFNRPPLPVPLSSIQNANNHSVIDTKYLPLTPHINNHCPYHLQGQRRTISSVVIDSELEFQQKPILLQHSNNSNGNEYYPNDILPTSPSIRSVTVSNHQKCSIPGCSNLAVCSNTLSSKPITPMPLDSCSPERCLSRLSCIVNLNRQILETHGRPSSPQIQQFQFQSLHNAIYGPYNEQLCADLENYKLNNPIDAQFVDQMTNENVNLLHLSNPNRRFCSYHSDSDPNRHDVASNHSTIQNCLDRQQPPIEISQQVHPSNTNVSFAHLPKIVPSYHSQLLEQSQPIEIVHPLSQSGRSQYSTAFVSDFLNPQTLISPPYPSTHLSQTSNKFRTPSVSQQQQQQTSFIPPNSSINSPSYTTLNPNISRSQSFVPSNSTLPITQYTITNPNISRSQSFNPSPNLSEDYCQINFSPTQPISDMFTNPSKSCSIKRNPTQTLLSFPGGMTMESSPKLRQPLRPCNVRHFPPISLCPVPGCTNFTCTGAPPCQSQHASNLSANTYINSPYIEDDLSQFNPSQQIQPKELVLYSQDINYPNKLQSQKFQNSTLQSSPQSLICHSDIEKSHQSTLGKTCEVYMDEILVPELNPYKKISQSNKDITQRKSTVKSVYSERATPQGLETVYEEYEMPLNSNDPRQSTSYKRVSSLKVNPTPSNSIKSNKKSNQINLSVSVNKTNQSEVYDDTSLTLKNNQVSFRNTPDFIDQPGNSSRKNDIHSIREAMYDPSETIVSQRGSNRLSEAPFAISQSERHTIITGDANDLSKKSLTIINNNLLNRDGVDKEIVDDTDSLYLGQNTGSLKSDKNQANSRNTSTKQVAEQSLSKELESSQKFSTNLPDSFQFEPSINNKLAITAQNNDSIKLSVKSQKLSQKSNKEADTIVVDNVQILNSNNPQNNITSKSKPNPTIRTISTSNRVPFGQLSNYDKLYLTSLNNSASCNFINTPYQLLESFEQSCAANLYSTVLPRIYSDNTNSRDLFSNSLLSNLKFSYSSPELISYSKPHFANLYLLFDIELNSSGCEIDLLPSQCYRITPYSEFYSNNEIVILSFKFILTAAKNQKPPKTNSKVVSKKTRLSKIFQSIKSNNEHKKSPKTSKIVFINDIRNKISRILRKCNLTKTSADSRPTLRSTDRFLSVYSSSSPTAIPIKSNSSIEGSICESSIDHYTTNSNNSIEPISGLTSKNSITLTNCPTSYRSWDNLIMLPMEGTTVNIKRYQSEPCFQCSSTQRDLHYSNTTKSNNPTRSSNYRLKKLCSQIIGQLDHNHDRDSSESPIYRCLNYSVLSTTPTTNNTHPHNSNTHNTTLKLIAVALNYLHTINTTTVQTLQHKIVHQHPQLPFRTNSSRVHGSNKTLDSVSSLKTSSTLLEDLDEEPNDDITNFVSAFEYK